LSKGHIRPQHTIICHVGASLVEIKESGQFVETAQTKTPPRGEITCFSQKSRQRLRMDLAKVDQHKAGRPIFGTLTYPNEFPWEYEVFKRDLHTFGKRFLRHFPSAGFHWKLEFQQRGAPHFHPIFWSIPADRLGSFRIWLALKWFEVVGSGDGKHLVAGTSAEIMRSQFAIMRYCAGYTSKLDQTLPGQNVGRYWGIVGRENIPYGKPESVTLTPGEAILMRRTARRQIQASNRIRRIKHAEKLWPNMTNDYLSGRYRQARKECPHMNPFKRRPKKLRLRNNKSVNLFCDASFWRRAIEALCELAVPS
jgi:hypothetical protein